MQTKERRLPIVLISKDLASEKALVDPSEVASELCGLSEVYVLADKWAAFALTDMVGKQFSCYNGAIRIYWPDFGLANSPDVPLYFPDKVRNLPTHFLYVMAPLSALRWVRGPIAMDAAELLDEIRRRENEALRVNAKEKGNFEELASLLDKDNRHLEDEVSRLKSQVVDLNQQVAELRTQLNVTQENLQAVWLPPPRTEPSATERADEKEPTKFDSVLAAVRDAQTKFDSTLIFQESALRSAEDSPFKQPEKVSRALLALHEVCLGWKNSKKGGQPFGSFEKHFQDKGFTYKAAESQTSTGKWKDEYQMTYKGKIVPIEQHLALGKGGPDTCLRIHFYTDEELGKFVVAHVGRHKTNTKT